MKIVFCIKFIFYLFVIACAVVAIILPYTLTFPPYGSFGGTFNESVSIPFVGDGRINKPLSMEKIGERIAETPKRNDMVIPREELGKSLERSSLESVLKVASSNNTYSNNTITPETVLEVFKLATIAMAAPVAAIFILGAIAVLCQNRCFFVLVLCLMLIAIVTAGLGTVVNVFVYKGDESLCNSVSSDCYECNLPSNMTVGSNPAIDYCMLGAISNNKYCYYTSGAWSDICENLPKILEILSALFAIMFLSSVFLFVFGCCCCSAMGDDDDDDF